MKKTNSKTQPLTRFENGQIIDPNDLAAKRYWTSDMIQVWWAERTFEYSLLVQWVAAQVLSEEYPQIVDPNHAQEIISKANLNSIDPNRIREIEEKTGHDIIAINKSLEEQVSKEAAAHINKAKTSADTTQPAKALQLKKSVEIIVKSTENLRDILLEKAIEWKDIPHMDNTHLYDALPTVAWRPFVHYIEMLQSDLDLCLHFYKKSIIWKWADATGNHHSAKALWIDWISLQQKYCERLGIWYMDAQAQTPWLEYEADLIYAMSRLSETLNNIAKFVAWWRSDDVNIFINKNPQKKKGSSAMPHKDSKNWNPTTEEQIMSLRNYMTWNLVTAMMNCEMPYARNLAASSNSRINYEYWFKYLDNGIRLLSNVIYWLWIDEKRSIQRVKRSYGVVTAQAVMTYLTDSRTTTNPMSRSLAHDITAKLATIAWDLKKQFCDIIICDNDFLNKLKLSNNKIKLLWEKIDALWKLLFENEDQTLEVKETIVKNYILWLSRQITSRLLINQIIQITNPLEYIGESKRIIELVFEKYYKKTTIE